MHIRDLRRLRDHKTLCTVATSFVRFKFDYCNSLFYNIDSSQNKTSTNIPYCSCPCSHQNSQQSQRKPSSQITSFTSLSLSASTTNCISCLPCPQNLSSHFHSAARSIYSLTYLYLPWPPGSSFKFCKICCKS